MTGIVFTVQAQAVALQTAMNAKLGYPKQPTFRGSAVPPGLGVTDRCADVVAHPTLPNQFALQESPEILASEGVVSIGVGVRTSLTLAWFPDPLIAQVG